MFKKQFFLFFILILLGVAQCSNNPVTPPPAENLPDLANTVIEPDGSLPINDPIKIFITFPCFVESDSIVLSGSLSEYLNGSPQLPINIQNPYVFHFQSIPEDGIYDFILDVFNENETSLYHKEIQYSLDNTPPSMISINPNNRILTPNQSISIEYNEIINGIEISGSISVNADFEEQAKNLSISPKASTPGWNDGLQDLIITVYDLAGNKKENTFSFIIDADAPSVRSITPSPLSTHNHKSPISINFTESLNVDSFILTGSITNFDLEHQHDVYTNDTLIIHPPSSGFPLGHENMMIQASDLAGNPLSAPLYLNYLMDNGDIPRLKQCNPPSDSLIPAQSKITLHFNKTMDKTTLSFSGSLDIGFEEVWQSQIHLDDTLTLMPIADYPNGEGNLIVRVKDLTNCLLEEEIHFQVDGISPAVLLIQPANHQVLLNTQAIQIQFSEAIDQNSLMIDESIFANTDREWLSEEQIILNPVQPFSPGNHSLRLVFKDKIANTSSHTVYYTVDDQTSPCIISINPASGNILDQDQPIELQFSEPMDTSSLDIAGDWASFFFETQWSKTEFENDTLKLSPTDGGAWPLGEQTLELQVSDLVGDIISSTMEYEIQDIDYVRKWTPVESGVNSCLRGIFGISGSLYACGDHGTLLYNDGSGWERIVLETESDLYAIDAADSTKVWIAGENNTLICCDGKECSFVSMGINNYLQIQDLHCFDASTFILVGLDHTHDYRQSLICEGYQFYRENTPEKAGIYGVWGWNLSNVWACGGEGNFIFYNGSLWEKIAADDYPTLNDIDGMSLDHRIYMVGNIGIFLVYDIANQVLEEIETGINTHLNSLKILHDDYMLLIGSNGVILNYDGSQCFLQESNTNFDLMDIHCVASDEFYVVGDNGIILKGSSW